MGSAYNAVGYSVQVHQRQAQPVLRQRYCRRPLGQSQGKQQDQEPGWSGQVGEAGVPEQAGS